MAFIYAAIGLVAGVIIGIISARLMTPEYQKHKQIQKDLEKSKFELEQQRQDLADHFAHTAEMLDALGKDYTKLYQHMAQTSSQLLPNIPEQDNPFVKQLTEPKSENKTIADENIQPKDYANGATGVLKEQKKEIFQAEDVVKAS